MSGDGFLHFLGALSCPELHVVQLTAARQDAFANELDRG